jgi:hypothetical protein
MGSLDKIQRGISASHYFDLICELPEVKTKDYMWMTPPIEGSTNVIVCAYFSNSYGCKLIQPNEAKPGTWHDIDTFKLPPNWKDKVKRCAIVIPEDSPGVDSWLMDWTICFLMDESSIGGLKLNVRADTIPEWFS